MANVVSSLVDIQYAENEKVGEKLNELFENIDRDDGEATCEAVYGDSASEDDFDYYDKMGAKQVIINEAWFDEDHGEMRVESASHAPEEFFKRLNELLVELGAENHLMEIQYWDESYDPVGAMFGYHNPVRLVNIESTKYFDMPDSNYGSEWDQFIDAVDNEKDRCLEEARKIVCSK